MSNPRFALRPGRLGAAILSIVAILMLAACSEPRWSAAGTVEGAAGRRIIAEAPDGRGGWYPVDTATIADDGTFLITGTPFGHPELLRLSLDGAQAYFPVDSIEQISFSASAADFQKSARISGTPSADRMQQANDLIAAAVAKNGAAAAASDAQLKRSLAELMLQDPADITSYYLVFHNVGGARLFNPADRRDLRIIGAVANAFTQQRPADPRTPLLKELYLSSKAAVSPSQPVVLQAPSIGYPDIALADEKGATRRLSDAVAKGNVTLVSFIAYTADNSPATNVELNRIRQAGGVEIYQIGVDPDEFQWRQSARNLPWTTVYNSPKDGVTVLATYNVTTLPVTFVINRQGELVERVDDITRLASTVNKYR